MTAAIPPACCAGADNDNIHTRHLAFRNDLPIAARGTIVTGFGAVADTDVDRRMYRVLYAYSDTHPHGVSVTNAFREPVALTEPVIHARYERVAFTVTKSVVVATSDSDDNRRGFQRQFGQ
jgi:hypothetical protein